MSHRLPEDQRLAHLYPLLRAIRNVVGLISKETDRDRLLQSACDYLIETRGYFYAWIGLVESGGGLRTAAKAGTALPPARWKPEEMAAFACCKKTIATPGVTTVGCADHLCLHCPAEPDCPEMDNLFVRLEYSNRVFGIFRVGIPPGASNPQERALFEEVASDFAFALFMIEEKTKKEAMEAALRESEKSYSVVCNSTPDGILVADEKNQGILYANPSICFMLGYVREELLGMRVSELYARSGEGIPPDLSLSETTPENEPSPPATCRCRRKNGVLFWAEQSSTRAKIGGLECRLYFFRDITERVSLQQVLLEAAEKYRAIFETTGAATVILDENGDISLANSEFEKWSGLSKAEMEGRIHFLDFVAPEDQERLRAGRAERLAQMPMTPQHDEFHFKSVTGEIRHVHRSVSMIPGSRQSVLSLLDITPLKTAERAQRENLDRLEALLNNTPDLAWLKDQEGRFIAVNEPFARACGRKVEEVIGLTDRDLWPEERATGYQAADQEVIQSGQRKRMEEKIQDPEGRIFWVETVKQPIFGERGKVTGTAGIARDITDRLKTEEEKRRLEQQLYQSSKMEAIGLLAGGVAHDFNNLLMVILGHANLLKCNLPEGEIRQSAQDIERAAERAAELTRQLLGFASKGKNQEMSVPIRNVVEESCRLLSRTIDKQIVLERDFGSESPQVLGDPTQLQQILMNLGINARDAMPDGGRMTFGLRMVTLSDAERARLELAGNTAVLLTVADTGKGIPEPIRRRIFEPFFTTKPIGQGTGLGLAMAYGIVKNHGGAIAFDSEIGKGTTFKIYLPPIPKTEVTVPAPEPVLAKGRGRIMLVDDEPAVRMVVALMLEHLGYAVLSPNNALEAIELFRTEHVTLDLVIVDLMMPELSGRECFYRLKAIDPGVRALISSGYALEENLQDLFEAGVLGLIQKPYRMPKLSEALEKALVSPRRIHSTNGGDPG